MSLRDILVHVDDGPHSEKRFQLALRLARRQNAELFALFSQTAPRGLSLTTRTKEKKKRYKKIAQAVEQRCQALADKALVNLDWKTARYPRSDEMVTRQLLHYTQHMDLAIVGQHDPDRSDGTLPHDLAERLVLESGRPILVIPYAGEFKALCRRVMVAWNTGRESVRAVNDAIPLMRDAKKVHILAIDPRKKGKRHGAIPSADIADHLKRHGIKAHADYLNTRELDPGNTLLSMAADESADLLVMGAYGHHPLTEWMLGGVTRDILRHMTVPVLMSH